MLHLKEGDKAPAINSLDQNGNKIDLADFKGSKVILFFYPKADTPGCTAEACNLRDYNEDLLAKGFKVIGISADDQKKQSKFQEKYNLPFPLIPDTEKKVINDYGVWGPKKFMGKKYDGIYRTTFVISEDGTIEKIFTKVETKDHAEQILKEYNLI
ncbi:MAG: thioredoxin-dependent thiol peroxidase [Bacteroidales bacterium]|nr:thioredoxin-dependent thiol peroxidase [Bacteroidales bacterium]